MSLLISPLELSDAVSEMLEQAGAEIREKVNAEAEKIAGDVLEKLKRDSPKDTKKYSKSWIIDERENKIAGNKHYIIKNEKHYRLTHLLEHGHVNRNGSRTEAKPHIGKINDAACREFERRVVNILSEV